eukprot:04835_4
MTDDACMRHDLEATDACVRHHSAFNSVRTPFARAQSRALDSYISDFRRHPTPVSSQQAAGSFVRLPEAVAVLSPQLGAHGTKYTRTSGQRRQRAPQTRAEACNCLAGCVKLLQLNVELQQKLHWRQGGVQHSDA